MNYLVLWTVCTVIPWALALSWLMNKTLLRRLALRRRVWVSRLSFLTMMGLLRRPKFPVIVWWVCPAGNVRLGTDRYFLLLLRTLLDRLRSGPYRRLSLLLIY